MSAPNLAALFAQRVIIGVGDMAVSNNPQVILSTYALGSCIGVIAYDSVSKVGGILHFMLPDSGISPDKAAKQPAMFGNTGMPMFFKALMGMKADPRRLRIFVAGGAGMLAGQDPFKIGERNSAVTFEFLSKHGLSLTHREIGGSINRTVHLEINTGSTNLKTPLANEQFSLAA
ncbi:MAG TPA: chemotaxis protein CheD [Lacunisphaera sp.]|jgi:chemotaxis protein CheD